MPLGGSRRLLGRRLRRLLCGRGSLLLVPTGSGGNHTALVALTFVTNEAPRAAHFSLSVRPFNRLLMSISFLPLVVPARSLRDPESIRGVHRSPGHHYPVGAGHVRLLPAARQARAWAIPPVGEAAPADSRAIHWHARMTSRARPSRLRTIVRVPRSSAACKFISPQRLAVTESVHEASAGGAPAAPGTSPVRFESPGGPVRATLLHSVATGTTPQHVGLQDSWARRATGFATHRWGYEREANQDIARRGHEQGGLSWSSDSASCSSSWV